MIGIIDYGMGNIHSVRSAFERMGESYLVSSDPEELRACEGLLLPGVGSFRDAMIELNQSGLSSFIKEQAESGKPLLGICLGMQLLFEESEENGPVKGLGLLPGKAVKFKGIDEKGNRYKVPHMGWNLLRYHNAEHPVVRGLKEGYVYFVHSYVIETEAAEVVIASAVYDVDVPAVVGLRNIAGTQFHPEKSSLLGMGMLRNFCKMVKEGEYA